MRCRHLSHVVLMVAICTASATSLAADDWRTLSKLNDPPGRPSLKAARVATQGMDRIDMIHLKHKLTTALTRAHPDTDPVAKGILKREILLIEVAMEGK